MSILFNLHLVRQTAVKYSAIHSHKSYLFTSKLAVTASTYFSIYNIRERGNDLTYLDHNINNTENMTIQYILQ